MDAEIKSISAENPELLKVPPLEVLAHLISSRQLRSSSDMRLLGIPNTFINNKVFKNSFFALYETERVIRYAETAVKNIADSSLGIPQIKSFMNALKLTWIRKFKNSNHMWRQIACQVYQNMDDIDMYGPSIYSKEKEKKKRKKNTSTVIYSGRTHSKFVNFLNIK